MFHFCNSNVKILKCLADIPALRLPRLYTCLANNALPSEYTVPESASVCGATRRSPAGLLLPHYKVLTHHNHCLHTSPPHWDELKDKIVETLTFGSDKRIKLEKDVVIFSYNNRIECVIFNLMAVLIGLVFIWVARYIHYSCNLSQITDEEAKHLELIPIVRNLELEPYRYLIETLCVLSGLVIAGGMLRYSLRSVRELAVLRDGCSLRITSNGLLGNTKTRITQLSHVYVNPAHMADLAHQEDCVLQVSGVRPSYILSFRGTVLQPDVFITDITTLKPFVRR